MVEVIRTLTGKMKVQGGAEKGKEFLSLVMSKVDCVWRRWREEKEEGKK